MLQLQRASAGSGKTYTLTKIYIRNFLAKKVGVDNTGNDIYRLRSEKEMKDVHGRILAITFTNKATNEMKQRIVRALADLAGVTNLNKKIDYLDDFTKEFNASIDEIKKASMSALRILLHGYSDFQISTIDSFFQTILRTLAVETDRNDTYQIELDDKYLSQMGVDTTLSQVNSADKDEKNKARLWIQSLITDMLLLEEGQWNPFSNSKSGLHAKLINFSELFHSEEFKDKIEPELMDYFENVPDLIQVYKDYKNAHKSRHKYYSNLMEKNKTEISNFVEGDFSDLNSHYSKLWTATTPKVGKVEFKFGKSITDLDDSDDSKPFKKNKYSKQYYGMLDLLLQQKELMQDWEIEDRFWNQNNKKLYYLGLIQSIKENIAKFREDNNIIPLSDTNRILKGIINDDDTPFIYERIGTYINHYLIDEFQDTSTLQWQNLAPLIAESLSHEEDYENLIIGDVKQSIYRFRNAEPMLIQKTVPDQFSGRTRLCGVDVEENTNWRSSREVVKFNNSFFTSLVSKLKKDNVFVSDSSGTTIVEVSKLYENVIQKVRNEKTPGYVEVVLFSENNVNADDIYSQMGGLVQRLLAKGYRQRDIAFLVNTNNQGSQLIENLLQYNLMHQADDGYQNIEVVSEESLKIADSWAVKLILSVLELFVKGDQQSNLDSEDQKNTLDQENDARESGKSVQKDGIRRHNRVDLQEFLCNYNFLQAQHSDSQPSEIIAKYVSEGAVVARVASQCKEIHTLALPALIENIIERFVSADLRESDVAFISAFQDKVLDYCQKYPSDVASFLKWWKDVAADKSSISSPDGYDAVQIMTIHKSKGLEFKCVILPFADWNIGLKSQGHIPTIWVKPQLPNDVNIKNIPPYLPLDLTDKLQDTIYHNDYLREKNKEVVDMLNKTYVAFTRAVNELYIFAPYKENNADKKHDALGNYLKDCLDEISRKWVGDETTKDYILRPHDKMTGQPSEIVRISIGDKNIEDDEYVENDESKYVPQYGYIDYFYCVGGVSEHDVEESYKNAKSKSDQGNSTTISNYYVNSHTHILSSDKDKDHDEDREEANSLIETEASRLRGKKLHSVMECVNVVADLHKSINSMRVKGRFSKKEGEEMEKLLKERLSNPSVARWFDPNNKIIVERAILSPGNRRPDRIVITPDGDVEVIDYKFGDKLNDGQYSTQVRRYIRLLKSINSEDGKTPKYKNVRGYIWYVTLDIVKEVSSATGDNEK